MLTAEARVETEHASRHIVRVCRHLGHMLERSSQQARGHGAGHRPHGREGAHHGPDRRRLDWSDTYAVVDVGWGRCVMQARAGALEVRVDADDEDGLRRLQEMAAHRLTTGTHERLTVTWEAPLTLATVRDQDGDAGRGRSLRNWLLGGAGALLVGWHLLAGPILGLAGLGAVGALLSGRRLPGWASTAADVVVALIVLKFALMALNALVLGRLLGRRQAVQQALDRLPPAAGRVLRWVFG